MNNIIIGSETAQESRLEKSKEINTVLPKELYNVKVSSKNNPTKSINLLEEKICVKDQIDLIEKAQKKHKLGCMYLQSLISGLMMISIVGYIPSLFFTQYAEDNSVFLMVLATNYRKKFPNSPIEHLFEGCLNLKFAGSVIRSIEAMKGKNYEFTLEDFLAFSYNKTLSSSLLD